MFTFCITSSRPHSCHIKPVTYLIKFTTTCLLTNNTKTYWCWPSFLSGDGWSVTGLDINRCWWNTSQNGCWIRLCVNVYRTKSTATWLAQNVKNIHSFSWGFLEMKNMFYEYISLMIALNQSRKWKNRFYNNKKC